MAEYTEAPTLATLPDSEETNTRWPSPRSAIASPSRRARIIGARRFTVSARSISSTEKEVEDAAGGQRGVGDEHVDLPASRTSASAAPGSARSATTARPPVSAASASSASARRPVSTSDAPARGERPRDRCAQPARRAGEQDASGRRGSRSRGEDGDRRGEPVQEVLAADRADLARREEARGGRAAEPCSSAAASWWAWPNIPRPRPLQENSSAPGRGAPAERRHARARARSRRSRSALSASRACSRTTWPGWTSAADRHLAGRRGRRRRGRGRGSRPARSRACWRRRRSPSAGRPARARRSSAGERLDRLAQLLERRAPGQLADDVPSAAVIVSSGPIGAAPCETHGRISTPSSRTPTAPSSTHLVAGEERALVRPASAPTRGRRAAAPSARPSESERSTASVGERARVGEQDHAPAAPVELRHAGERAAALARSPRPARGRRSRVPPPRFAAQTDDRGAVLDLARRRRSRRPRRSRPARSGSSASCTASSVASGAARCAPEANTTARSHVRPPSPPRAAAPASMRAGARIGVRREAGADADAHRSCSHYSRRGARCHPDADVGRHVDEPDGAPRADDAPPARMRCSSGCGGHDGGVERADELWGRGDRPMGLAARRCGSMGLPLADPAPAEALGEVPLHRRGRLRAHRDRQDRRRDRARRAAARRGERPGRGLGGRAPALPRARILTGRRRRRAGTIGAPPGRRAAGHGTRLCGRVRTAARTPRSTALLDAGRRPIVVGGTGLYLRAALADLDLRPPPAPGVRERWTARLAAEGPAALHARLARATRRRPRRSRRRTPSASSAPSSCSTPARRRRPSGRSSSGPPRCAIRRCWSRS